VFNISVDGSKLDDAMKELDVESSKEALINLKLYFFPRLVLF
jgi:hypothetical protein